MNFTLTKQFAVTIQSSKPFRSLKLSSSTEHIYYISRRQRISEVSSSGKVRKILNPRKESKILASGVSECGSLIAGLTSTGQIIICSKEKKIFQSFLLPPQIKLSMEILKPDHCSLYIYSRGLILIAPNDQVWMWKSDEDLKDPFNISPHLKGIWLNLNSSSMLKGRSEVTSWRSNVSESKPSSNSSRPATIKSRFTTHSFAIRASSDYIRGNMIGVLRVWLRSINEDSCILESRFLYINHTVHNKSGNVSSSISAVEEFVYKGLLEFWTKKGQKDMGLIARLDHSCALSAIAVNSSHPYFCQLVFLNPITGMCTTRKLCNYVTVEDIPNTSNDGQTSFWIDDLSWSPDDSFLSVAFKTGFISIFNRLGEPVPFVLDMRSSSCEQRIFSHAFFTTDPESIKKFGSFLSIDWTAKEVVISDGYSICELCISKFPVLREVIPILIPSESEVPDISINISHETNPIPSDIDSGPKRKNIEQAFLLLRSCWSNSHLMQNKEDIFSITSWISNVIPPQLHEEINYTALPNPRFETESRLANGLILKKKVHAIDIYRQFSQIIEMGNWSIVNNSDSQEWILSVAYQVFKYMIADQQALYAWNILKLFERWAGFRLQRIRNMMVIYSLIQYRNHQANHINVVYFLIAFVAVRGNSQNSVPIISQNEEDFIRNFVKSFIDSDKSEEKEGLNCFYYLAKRVKEKVEGSINYLLGYSNNFSSTYQEIAFQLLKGNLKYVDSFVSTENLILFAYFYDLNEPFFISPVEAASVFAAEYSSLTDLLESIKKVSQIPCSKDKKFCKDSAFLYYSLRIYSKLDSLLPVDQAFYAVNKMIPFLDEADVPKAIILLKKMFVKDDSLKLLNLCHADLKFYFQHYALEILKDKIKDFILNFNSKYEKSEICEQVYNKVSSEELAGLLTLFRTLIGRVTILKDKTGNWLDLGNSNFSNSSSVFSTVQETFKQFWHVHIKENIAQSNCIDWRLRVLSLDQEKTENLEKILKGDLDFSQESKNIIALYLRSSMFTGDLTEKYRVWLEKLKNHTENLNILHSLEQPSYANPWVFDLDFLQFAEKMAKIEISETGDNEAASKSWNSSVKVLSKQYKINGFYRYCKGVYSEVKENSNLDYAGFEYLLNDNCQVSVNGQARPEKNYLCPLHLEKKRLKLEILEKPVHQFRLFPVQQQVSVKKIANLLKLVLKRTFFSLKPVKSAQTSDFLTKKAPLETFLFFTMKDKDLSESTKTLPLKFTNILESQNKPSKHRRIQSVILPSVSVQKPFHIIRVQKSKFNQ